MSVLCFANFAFAQDIEQFLQILEGQSVAEKAHKCGTHLVLELRNSKLSEKEKFRLNKISERPTNQFSYTTPSSKFTIHFDISGENAVSLEDSDNSGTPDYVELMLETFDSVYRFEIDTLGYTAPPISTTLGSGKYDIYIENFNGGVFAYTDSDDGNKFNSYIRMDNNYTEGSYSTQGIDAVKVTAAHEFLHMVQFGLLGGSILNDEIPFAEMSATWMEDVMFEGINDYYNYLDGFSNAPETFLFSGKNNYRFGASIWCHFLEEKFGRNIVREIWNGITASKRNYHITDTILTDSLGTSFEDAYNEFVIWTFFTGKRTVENQFFSEAEFYPETFYSQVFDWTGIATSVEFGTSELPTFLSPISYKNFKITKNISTEISNEFVILPTENKVQFLSLGFANGSPMIDTLEISTSEEKINLSLQENALYLISSQFVEENDFALRLVSNKIEIAADNFSLKHNEILDFRKEQFLNLLVSIEDCGSCTGSELPEILIFSSSGREVKKITSYNSFENFEFSLIWDGTNKENQKVATGVYILLARIGSKIQKSKVAVVK
ncbi:MAG: hypothetical protein DWQ06_12095 [Calditrichaeota bacterium]|nr:MAG: hypothetical protein DWQ06_12095 [Calditrichota bacterium]